MRPVYSHSRLSSFENCPKQFHFRYVLKIPSETESIEAFLGKRVHEVLERLYRFVGEGQIPGVAKVLQRFRLNWAERYHAERIQIARAENPAEAYREIGERCLRQHYHAHYPFDGDDTLGIEERVTFALDPDGAYRMQGVIDRVARARDGALEVHDYKTGARVPPQRILDEDRQLALYQLALATRFDDGAPVRLVWHYLQAGQRRISSRTPEQLERLCTRTIELIDRIHGEERFEPRTGPLCGWCEYKGICPAFATERAAEEAAAGAPPVMEAPAPELPPVSLPPFAPAPPIQLALFEG